MATKRIHRQKETQVPHGNRGNTATVGNEAKLDVTSPAFENDHFIPARHTCDGENINPELDVLNIPQDAKSIAIIVDDPDAPKKIWIHWLVWNLPPIVKVKEQNIDGTDGMNDFNLNQYSGPCPPAGRTHRYFFKVYALDTMLDLPPGSSVEELHKAITGHIIGYGELKGLYKKDN